MREGPEDGRPTSPPSPDALERCAAHPERRLLAPCTRCAVAVCDACARRPAWGDDAVYCAACVAALEAAGQGVTLPWEAPGRSFAWRLAVTLRDVVVAPGRFFARMGPRGYRPALAFQYTVLPALLALNAAATWPRLEPVLAAAAGRLPEGFVAQVLGGLALVVVLVPLAHGALAGWLHLHLVLFGARRGFAATYRFTSYLYALALPLGALQLAVAQVFLRGGADEVRALLAGQVPGPALAAALASGACVVAYATVAGARVQRLRWYAALAAVLLVLVEGAGLLRLAIGLVAQHGYR